MKRHEKQTRPAFLTRRKPGLQEHSLVDFKGRRIPTSKLEGTFTGACAACANTWTTRTLPLRAVGGGVQPACYLLAARRLHCVPTGAAFPRSRRA
eukprot:6202184-Pleurochrysis_carterae.AAC.3